MVTHNLTLLAWTLVLALVQLGLAAVAKRMQEPAGWAMGARDQAQPYSGMAARLVRAQNNLMETLPVFATAVLICHFAGKETAVAGYGVLTYFWARVLYLPIYAFGFAYVRTLVWLVSLIGLCAVLAACLTPGIG